MKEPIRVLQVLGTTGLGGAESRVMDLYRNIDRERVQFDFAVHTSKKGYFDEEIEALMCFKNITFLDKVITNRLIVINLTIESKN